MGNRTYIVYYNCPKCANPKCNKLPKEESYVILTTPGKMAARDLFIKTKTCRHMQVTKIERKMFKDVWHID